MTGTAGRPASRTGGRRLIRAAGLLAAVGILLGASRNARAPIVMIKEGAEDALVKEGVRLRIEDEEIGFLARTGKLSREQEAARRQDLRERRKAFDQRLGSLSEEERAKLTKRVDDRFAIVFPPIQQQWAAAATPLPGRYALFFATDTFDHYATLSNPVFDAETVAKDLERIYGFRTEIVRNSTYKQMRAKLAEYEAQKRIRFAPGDELLVYFAGHGKFDELTKEGYVIARDSSNDESPSPAFTHSQLQTVIDQMPVDHVMVVLDVCFGGTFDTKIAMATHRGAEPSGLTRAQLIERKLRYRSRLYLTSGGKEYVPDGRPGAHSPFTRALLGVLRTEGNEDHVLTFEEIRVALQKLDPMPYGGPFASSDPGGDFIFISTP